MYSAPAFLSCDTYCDISLFTVAEMNPTFILLIFTMLNFSPPCVQSFSVITVSGYFSSDCGDLCRSPALTASASIPLLHTASAIVDGQLITRLSSNVYAFLSLISVSSIATEKSNEPNIPPSDEKASSKTGIPFAAFFCISAETVISPPIITVHLWWSLHSLPSLPAKRLAL